MSAAEDIGYEAVCGIVQQDALVYR